MRFSKLFILLAIVLSVSCQNEKDTVFVNPYSRSVGVEGGTVAFYRDVLPGEETYPEYDNKEPVIELVIPAGALEEEVTFSYRERDLGSSYSTAYEILPNNITFKKPVQIGVSYGMDEITFLSTQKCFNKAYQIPLDINIKEAEDNSSYWQLIEDVVYDDERLRFTTNVTSTNHLYTFENANEDVDYEICSSTNDHIDIDLGGDNNRLVIPSGAVSSETTIDKGNHFLPPAFEMPRPVVGEYIIPSTTGYYSNLVSNNPVLDEEAVLFMQASQIQAGEIWLDWPQVVDDVKILLIDTLNGEAYVKKVYDVDPTISNQEELLFGTYIDELGMLTLGLPLESFKLRLGGKVDVSIYGDYQYDTVFENYDYGGARVWLFNVYYDINMAPGKDQSQGYVDINVSLGSDFDTQEFPSSQLDYFRIKFYDENDDVHWARLYTFESELSYSKIDYDNGWIHGNIKSKTDSSGYLDDGTKVGIDVYFQFRIAEWKD